MSDKKDPPQNFNSKTRGKFIRDAVNEANTKRAPTPKPPGEWVNGARVVRRR